MAFRIITVEHLATAISYVQTRNTTIGDEGGMCHGECGCWKAGAFQCGRGNFSLPGRVELYLKANSMAQDKRVPVSFIMIGANHYTVLRTLLARQKLSEQPLSMLMETMRGQVEAKRVVMAEHFHFHRRQQAPGKTVGSCEAELRQLAIHCEFKDYLDQAV